MKSIQRSTEVVSVSLSPAALAALEVARDACGLVEKLRSKFGWNDVEAEDVVRGLLDFAGLVRSKTRVYLVHKNPTDNKILECAKEPKVDVIVSGDKKHLLSLKKFENIPIPWPPPISSDCTTKLTTVKLG